MNYPHQLLEDAYGQLRFAISSTIVGGRLNKDNACWLVRKDAWLALHEEAKVHGDGTPNTLLGFPVRITIDDEPETPDLRLMTMPYVSTITLSNPPV